MDDDNKLATDTVLRDDGGGTTFTLELPAKDYSKKPTAEQALLLERMKAGMESDEVCLLDSTGQACNLLATPLDKYPPTCDPGLIELDKKVMCPRDPCAPAFSPWLSKAALRIYREAQWRQAWKSWWCVVLGRTPERVIVKRREHAKLFFVNLWGSIRDTVILWKM